MCVVGWCEQFYVSRFLALARVIELYVVGHNGQSWCGMYKGWLSWLKQLVLWPREHDTCHVCDVLCAGCFGC